MTKIPKLINDWSEILKSEFNAPYFSQLMDFLAAQTSAGKVIFPKQEYIFNALNLCSFECTKVLIIGQDPYHGKGQANGLAFSVDRVCKIPPSLVNIYKELEQDLAVKNSHGDLSAWAKSGVLLLNSTLTVCEGEANSHKAKGWENLTERIVQLLISKKKNLVLILWGANAQSLIKHLDTTQHLVLRSAHPSPLSSYRGFFGSKPFSKCNDYLTKNGMNPIDWTVNSK